MDQILDINGEPIDAIWQAEFRGFFWGEGCLGVAIIRGMYRIQVVINLRADDMGVLVQFQKRLGGSLSLTHHTSFRHVRLNIANMSDCIRITRILAGGSDLPFAKKKQLGAWTEMLEIKKSAGGKPSSRYTPEQHARMRSLVTEIQELRNI